MGGTCTLSKITQTSNIPIEFWQARHKGHITEGLVSNNSNQWRNNLIWIYSWKCVRTLHFKTVIHSTLVGNIDLI